MNKMTRQEFIQSKQNSERSKHRGIFVKLTAEESDELYRKAAELGVSRTIYIRSILLYLIRGTAALSSPRALASGRIRQENDMW